MYLLVEFFWHDLVNCENVSKTFCEHYSSAKCPNDLFPGNLVSLRVYVGFLMRRRSEKQIDGIENVVH